MKAISLWQPWASAIALGCKRIETRHWAPRYRGPIAIHAAKRWGPDERDFAAEFAGAFDIRLRTPPLGAIVATARLTGCRRVEDILADGISEMEQALGNYAGGRYGWMLTDIVPLIAPIPFSGHQGLFDIPDNLLTPAAPQDLLL